MAGGLLPLYRQQGVGVPARPSCGAVGVLEDPSVAIDTNHIERAIRSIPMLRKQHHGDEPMRSDPACAD